MALARISRRQLSPEENAEFLKHVCPPTHGGPPPDPVTPTVVLARNLMVRSNIIMPDGSKMPVWIIEDPDDPVNGRSFPSPMIRVRQGEIVHVRVGAQVNTHTIHWHGIEPTPMHDGVGKLSFEIAGNFTYQWQPNQAGLYFYHCHKNTTLHFEMGLYGLLIVDPPGGQGFVAGYNPPQHIIPYDVEQFWVVDEFDSRWHRLNHLAFMQACSLNNPVDPKLFTQDGILHDFRPDVFLITGVPRERDDIPIMDPRVAIVAGAGQTILLRLLCAGYTVQQFTLPLDAEVIAMDGHPLGVPPNDRYSRPVQLPAGTSFRLTSARRWDILIRPERKGVFPVEVEFLHWITNKRLGRADTTITIV